MSPEQAFGEDGVDARSDLYSLACVLYEMLAGEAPFTGSTALAIVMLMSALGDAPMPLWGRVLYHLNTGDLEAAADWYQRMIDHRDPFCLVYAMGDATRPLRQHPRWRTLREQMRLPRTGAG